MRPSERVETGAKTALSAGVNPAPCPVPSPPGPRRPSLREVALMRDLERAMRRFWRTPEIPTSVTVCVNAPTVGEYDASLQVYGRLIGAIGSTASVPVNPGSPDERRREMTGAHPSLSVIDGSFRDIASDRSCIPAASFVGAVVLKGLGNFRALAGLGSGFTIGDSIPAACLAASLGQKPLFGPEMTAEAASIDDPAWVEAMRS